jgi:hypothetical protein
MLKRFKLKRLTSPIKGSKWPVSGYDRFNSGGMASIIYRTWSWVDSRFFMHEVAKKISCPNRESNPDYETLVLLFGLWGYWHCGQLCLLCQLRVIVKMIVEKQMECTLAGETEVLFGENIPQRHFCPLQNPTWPDPGRRCEKPATNRLSYGAAIMKPLASNFTSDFNTYKFLHWLNPSGYYMYHLL